MLIFLLMYPGPPGLEVTPHWEPFNEKEETGQVWLNFLLQTPRRAPLFSLAALRAPRWARLCEYHGQTVVPPSRSHILVVVWASEPRMPVDGGRGCCTGALPGP